MLPRVFSAIFDCFQQSAWERLQQPFSLRKLRFEFSYLDVVIWDWAELSNANLILLAPPGVTFSGFVLMNVCFIINISQWIAL